MSNKVPVSATKNDLDEPVPGSVGSPAQSAGWWVEAVSITLLIVALGSGLESWREWFSSVDRFLCSICVIVGLAVAFIRSNWEGEISKTRFAFAFAMWGLALVAILVSLLLGRPRLCGIAVGLALAAWCTMRVLGENIQHGMMLGLVFAIPTAIDAFAARGAFDWLESIALHVTSGLSDSASLSHVREGGQLIFGKGVADRFSCVGEWDSVVSFFGIAIFCILAFRRNLVPGLLAIIMSAIIWIAVRATAWVALAWFGVSNGLKYEWSFGLEVGLFVLGALLVISIDQFISTLFEPIPFEFINTDFPLFAFVWNWLCALPTLTVYVPQREGEFGEIEDDSEPLKMES